jgi:hypothetical protein
MTGATADGEHIDLVELLHRSDLPAADPRRVYDGTSQGLFFLMVWTKTLRRANCAISNRQRALDHPDRQWSSRPLHRT